MNYFSYGKQSLEVVPFLRNDPFLFIPHKKIHPEFYFLFELPAT